MQQLVVPGMLFHMTSYFRSTLEAWQFVPVVHMYGVTVVRVLDKVELFALMWIAS